MALPYLPDVTVGEDFPASGLTDATLAFAALAGRLAWVEFDAGFINDNSIIDRGNGSIYPITGPLVGGSAPADSATRSGATFAGFTSINCGDIMPLAADFTVVVVYKQSASAIGLLGSTGASWWALAGNVGPGKIYFSTGGGQRFITTNILTVGQQHSFIGSWDHGVGMVGFVDGVQDVGVLNPHSANAAPNFTIGDIPGLAGDRGWYGSILHVSLFDRRIVGADRDVIQAYLDEQFAAA